MSDPHKDFAREVVRASAEHLDKVLGANSPEPDTVAEDMLAGLRRENERYLAALLEVVRLEHDQDSGRARRMAAVARSAITCSNCGTTMAESVESGAVIGDEYFCGEPCADARALAHPHDSKEPSPNAETP